MIIENYFAIDVKNVFAVNLEKKDDTYIANILLANMGEEDEDFKGPLFFMVDDREYTIDLRVPTLEEAVSFLHHAAPHLKVVTNVEFVLNYGFAHGSLLCIPGKYMELRQALERDAK